MLDFSNVKSLTIPEGKVNRIVKNNGSEVWSQPTSALHPNLKCYLSGSQNTRAGYVDGTSVWEDLSGNGNDFTLTNVEFYGSDAVFNGSSSKATSSFVLQAPYTVITRLTRKGNWPSAVTIPVHNYDMTSSSSGDGIILRASAMEVSFRANSIQAVSKSSLPADGDCYVAYTVDANGKGSVYMDGTLIGTKTGVKGTITHPFVLGNSQSFWYKGGIEFVKIYNVSLTQAEIIEESKEKTRNKFRNGLIKSSSYFSSLENNGLRVTNSYSTSYCDFNQLNLMPNTTYYIHAEKTYTNGQKNASGRIANISGLGTLLDHNQTDAMFTTDSTIAGTLVFYGMTKAQAGVDTNVVVEFKDVYISTSPYQ